MPFFFADLILLQWGAYAFFMALSISDDVLPEFLHPLSNVFSTIARVFFMLGIFFITYLGIFFFIIGNLNKLHIPFIPILPWLLFEIYNNRDIFKKSTNIKVDISPYKLLRKLSAAGFLVTYAIIITSIFTSFNLAQNHLPIIIVISFGFMVANVIFLTNRKD